MTPFVISEAHTVCRNTGVRGYIKIGGLMRELYNLDYKSTLAVYCFEMGRIK